MRRALALAALALAGCGGDGAGRGAEPLVVPSDLLGGDREQLVIRSSAERPPLLVLLHGRGGSPDDFVVSELFEALEELGARAPAVLLVDGGDHSYYHDRREGRWGSHVLDEVIPAAVKELGADGARVAIGGFSMGGFGALDLARLEPRRFCAVGGHAPALWRTGGETPEGAFDHAEDFTRHDLFGAARAGTPYEGLRVWLDVGSRDPFRSATVAFARELGVRARVWPGEHSHAYIREHLDEYLRFYARALAECSR